MPIKHHCASLISITTHLSMCMTGHDVNGKHTPRYLDCADYRRWWAVLLFKVILYAYKNQKGPGIKMSSTSSGRLGAIDDWATTVTKFIVFQAGLQYLHASVQLESNAHYIPSTPSPFLCTNNTKRIITHHPTSQTFRPDSPTRRKPELPQPTTSELGHRPHHSSDVFRQKLCKHIGRPLWLSRLKRRRCRRQRRRGSQNTWRCAIR